MADERSTGVILRTRPLTETSLIVQWLSPDLGRISTVAKGARRQKSSFRGKLDLFYEAEFSFQRSRRSDLHTLREVGLRETHPAIRLEIDRLEQASYFSALLQQSTESETPLGELHSLFIGAISELERHPPQPQAVFAFELRLLEELGLAPDLASSPLSEGTRKLAAVLREGDWPMVFRLQAAPGQVTELRHFLHGYLLHHLDRLPPGRTRALMLP
ncbi:MAG TPA: DNA repair protein RecO [Verrucomicrobiales bacterium]|nr:DNA repair protein RecO [Verrucomicrobiales bacterium]